jgi:hypothetical protein
MLKIHFNAFWEGFFTKKAGDDFTFLKYVFEKVFGETVVFSSKDDADVLCESFFGQSLLKYKKWNISIFFSGESYIPQWYNEYTVVLYGIKSRGNIVSCPLFLSYTYCQNIIFKKDRKLCPKKGIVCVISNPNGSFRNKFLDNLEKKTTITYAGLYRKNCDCPENYKSQDYINFLSDFRLCISMENACVETYITEKIINPLRAQIIPVYWGSPCIEEYFNPDTDSVMHALTCPEKEYMDMINKDIMRKSDSLDNLISDIKNII